MGVRGSEQSRRGGKPGRERTAKGRREGRLAAWESGKAAWSRTADPESERGTQASSMLLGDVSGEITPSLSLSLRLEHVSFPA